MKFLAIAVVFVLALGAAAGMLLPTADGPVPAPATPATDEPAAAMAMPSIQVVKSPSCGCCGLWVDHLREHRFAVTTRDVSDVSPFKQQAGITPGLASCHTAFVDGYVIEGHVPAEDIRRLLQERPDAIGLTVPGMPIGSPGMEIEGRVADAYDVLLLHRDGSTSVFSHHAP